MDLVCRQKCLFQGILRLSEIEGEVKVFLQWLFSKEIMDSPLAVEAKALATEMQATPTSKGSAINLMNMYGVDILLSFRGRWQAAPRGNQHILQVWGWRFSFEQEGPSQERYRPARQDVQGEFLVLCGCAVCFGSIFRPIRLQLLRIFYAFPLSGLAFAQESKDKADKASMPPPPAKAKDGKEPKRKAKSAAAKPDPASAKATAKKHRK